MIPLLSIGFLTISIWDVFDIAIVGYLLYQVYKLLKGSLAFNIFIGVVLIYVTWWLVTRLEMSMLSLILGQLVSVGVILLLIVFQPEVRRFLLFLGKSTLRRRDNFFTRYFNKTLNLSEGYEKGVQSILNAIEIFTKSKTGALMIFTDNPDAEQIPNIGVRIDAEISTPLLESIFQKESPLHDGAVVISGGKVYAASSILPVSESGTLPQEVGLRHRAAVGITEGTKVLSLIVSEETGYISYARNGQLKRNITLEELKKILKVVFAEI